MKKCFVLGITVLLLATSLEAAPRNRRRSRRSRRARVNRVQYQTPQYYPTTQASLEPVTTTVTPAAAAVPDVGDPLPTVIETSADAATESAVVSAESATVAADAAKAASSAAAPAAGAVKHSVKKPVIPATPQNAALAELNALRARRGLFPFREDPQLTAVALQKASYQAQRRWVGHPGGSMGGARYEGVGMGPQFATCYAYATHASVAGAATVRGADGRRYHCLLLR